MLGYIQGTIISKNPEGNHCIVLSGDIGYEIVLPKNLFDSLSSDEFVKLWLHTHVREDQLTLFGFRSESEKAFFKQLLGVSGLGPKTALSLLGEHGVERLVNFIVQKKPSEIAEAPGVGKKLAERLVLELSGKIEKWVWVNALPKHEVEKTANRNITLPTTLRDDLSSALVHLGYQPNHIKATLDKLLEVEDSEKLGFEHCLKSALKAMSRGSVIGNG
jgi:holliday junction DNA helicase RuvA